MFLNLEKKSNRLNRAKEANLLVREALFYLRNRPSRTFQHIKYLTQMTRKGGWGMQLEAKMVQKNKVSKG